MRNICTNCHNKWTLTKEKKYIYLDTEEIIFVLSNGWINLIEVA